MAYMQKMGPRIKQSVRRVEWLDYWPYYYTWYDEEDSMQPTYVLTRLNSTVKRQKPVDLTVSVTDYAAGKYLHVMATFTSKDGPYGVSGYQATGFRAPSNEIAEMKSLAADSLRMKMRDEKFDVPTFMAEMPQTVKWIASSCKDMLDAYNFVKKGKWVEYLPKKAPKGAKPRRRHQRKKIFYFQRRDGSVYSYKLAMDRKAANRYLEWRFAVEPLVRDAQGIMDEFYSSGVKPNIQRVVGKTNRVFNRTTAWEAAQSNVTVRAGAYVEIGMSQGFAFRYGLNPLVTLWNLTPYSFMVDVWLPLGRYLGNLVADYGVTYRSTWTSVIEKSYSKTTPPNSEYMTNSIGTYELEEYTRTPGMPVNEFPKFRSAKDIMKSSLDALALVRQRVTSFHRSY